MDCSNRYRTQQSLNRLLVLCACCMFFVACGGNVKPDKPEGALVEGEGQAEVFVAIPNPYLAQTRSAPAEAKQLFNNALAAMQKQDWQTAHATLLSLTTKYPDLSGPFVNLGIVEWRLGDVEASEKAFRQAIVVNPLNNDAYNQAALMLREQGKFKEAEALYLQALAVWPHSYESNRNLGILYDLYMGKFDDAMKYYEMAEKLSAESDKEVEGWIIDLKRRLAK